MNNTIIINDYAYGIYTRRGDLEITIPLQSQEVLIDGEFVAFHVLRKYKNYSYDSFTYKSLQSPVDSFVEQFQNYARIRQYDFYRLWQAMQADYNPIENYNSIEVNKHGEIIASGTSKTETDGKDTANNRNVQSGSVSTNNPTVTNTDQYPEIKTTFKQGKTVDTQERTTYDNSTFNDVEKNTTQQDTADTTTQEMHTDTHTTSYDTSTTTNYNNLTNTSTRGNTIHNESTTETEYNTITKTIDTTATNFNTYTENKLTRSGNIGVTTSQQMIESEISLRMKDIILMFLDRVMESFCYLNMIYESGGDSGGDEYIIY